MDNDTVAALVGIVIFCILVFVALFTVARLLLRDRKVREVRIGFYMERDRDLEDNEVLQFTPLVPFAPTDEPTKVSPTQSEGRQA